MEPAEPYVSCIKINGVPILPPLMTENLRNEMNYYKNLAIAVEERLKMLEISKKQIEKDKRLESDRGKEEESGIIDDRKIIEIEKSFGFNYPDNNKEDEEEDDSSSNETETSTILNSSNKIKTVIDFPTRETQFSSLDTTVSEYTEEVIDNESPKCFICEDDNHARDEIFASSTCSDTVTESTDLNNYLEVSPSMEKNSTANTTPEIIIAKPQVPKSLDIIPITVDIPRKERINDNENDFKERNSSTPPKLVRQGSYILETPSPMLLAHMQTELCNNSEYVPTATINNNQGTKRREWNISQAKTEWENQIKNEKEFNIVASDNNNLKKNFNCYSGNQGRYRRNSTCGVNNQKIFKSLTNSKNSTFTSSSSYGFGSQKQSARSVDCIQTMLDRELVCKSPGGKIGRKNLKDNCGKIKSSDNNNLRNWKTGGNISILNLANRLGGSLGNLSNLENLSNFGGLNCKKKNQSNNESTMIEDGGKIGVSRSIDVEEKLVIIFKEIQRKHEEQMAELIEKQQKEQNNMQKEFEKQQVLLLGHIKKTFPGILIPQNENECLENVSEDVSPNREDDLNVVSIERQKNDENLSLKADNRCPLDYIYPLEEAAEGLDCGNEKEISKNERDEGKECGFDCNKRLEQSVERYSNVSRRLFPLDCNTTHVPIPANVLYTEEEIKAATIINSYARGYLVRRLMKTERVITLKNTYKEALHCMLKLHVDAPLNLPELNFHQRLQLQCDAASMNIAELFSQSAEERMQVIAQDREIKRSKSERPSSAHSYSFATQRTLARKKLKEMGEYPSPPISRPCSARSRCQTWTSNSREKRSQNIYHGIKRSTSAGTVRKPWR